ncbi:peptidase family M13 protein [Cardiosporidium cionae]|uniref:Peptidase family M13 protein n=1 Tax=Cardiosporidium cionae TaxID=476202 RepID=A0ABQ7J948_9APIC|nr:peptidase family M13 protein [Cardiosporidium cionae]|eukprot:KAF8820536.1 peptidase family M13 protein [Cardiosporidium cionae]
MMSYSRFEESKNDRTFAFLPTAGPSSLQDDEVITPSNQKSAVNNVEHKLGHHSKKGEGAPFTKHAKSYFYVLGLTLLILAIGGAILFLTGKGSCSMKFLSKGNNGFSTYGGNIRNHIPCTSSYCIKLAGARLSYMSHDAEPCKNWYSYSCGGFIEKHDIPTNKNTFSISQIASNEAQRQISDTYNENRTVTDYYSLEDVMFHHCLDSDGRAANGSSEMVEFIRKKTPELLFNRSEILQLKDDNVSKANFLGRLTNIGLLLGVTFKTDLSHYSVNPRHFMTWDGALDPFMVNQNTSVILQRAEEIFGLNDGNIDLRVKNISNYGSLLESAISLLHPNLTLEEIQKDYFPVKDFISASDSLSPLQWNDSTRTLMYSPDYFKEIMSFDYQVMIDAARIAALKFFAKTLSDDLQVLLLGTTVYSGNRIACMKNIEAVTELRYLHRVLDTDLLKTVDDLVKDLKSQFHFRILHSTMNLQPRKEALSKLASLIPRIGHPSWMNSLESIVQGLNKRIGSIDEYKNKSLAAIHAALAVNKLRYTLSKINHKKWDRLDDWAEPIYEVNAYYNPLYNEIVIPHAIMTHPYVETPPPNASPKESIIAHAFLFGGLGTVISHEISHAFDNKGIFWDSNGTISPWLSPPSKDFNDSMNCLEKQYSTYNVTLKELNHGYEDDEVIPLDGLLEISENMADNEGVKLASASFMSSVNSSLLLLFSTPLVGLNLDLSQLFYLAYSQTWCTLYKPDALVDVVTFDPHAPGKWRAEGPLRNAGMFAFSYNCKRHDWMSPVDSCSSWF